MSAPSPMFEQYWALKAAHPGMVLFFRMGDFYETFFDDAALCARELELTLTARNPRDPDPIPMAGVPHHQAAGYIQRLVDAGHKVAIADQLEEPSLAKGLVKRGVTRVVTPGMVLDPAALERSLHNWIAAIARDPDGRYGLAFLDASTGDLTSTAVATGELAAGEIARHEPREALLEPGITDEALARSLTGVARSEVLPEAWTRREAARELRELLGADLRGFGLEDTDPGARAAGALVRYAATLLGGRLSNVHRITPYTASGFLVLDGPTRRNLELFRSLLHGTRKGTLFQLLDRCGTAMGARLLREWLSAPLLDPAAIGRRHDAVALLTSDDDLRHALRDGLGAVADLERLAARVAQGLGNPRDLAAIRASLAQVPQLADRVAGPRALAAARIPDPLRDVHDELAAWLVDEPPAAVGDGGVIAPGNHAELDRIVRVATDALGVLDALEQREIAATGITSLKIRRNRNFGFYLEVTKSNLHRVPKHWLRKQTLTNGERFMTVELKEIEELVLGADERRLRLEAELFTALRDRVAAASARLLDLARRLAGLDALVSLADVAVHRRWVRPEVNLSGRLAIAGGRHPVVEAMASEERFVPNDVVLDNETRRLIVLTGPNMAGKSTVLRQTAILVILAQMGSFVPADSASVGVTDRVFTRVGAADDLARGQSTFMVEMSETAAILHGATSRSLVILDEIGRGTSTYDGLAIAWAVAEDLVDRIGCRALFATHYHELCALADARPDVVNQSVAVAESGDHIVFLRRLKDGGASRSYGIQCGRIAGLPAHVVARAGRLLTRFEKTAPRDAANQLTLFGSAPDLAPAPEPEPDPLRLALAAIDPDQLTPRGALEALYALKRLDSP